MRWDVRFRVQPLYPKNERPVSVIRSVLYSDTVNCCGYAVSVMDELLNTEFWWNDNDGGEKWYSEKPLSQCHPIWIHYYYYYYYYYCPCYHLYTRYLQLYTWNKPRFYGIQCCSCSVFTVCATCNVISPVQHVLYFSLSTSRSLCAVHNMAVLCSSLISCFPGTLLRCCLSDFSNGPSRPCYRRYHFCFHIPHALNFYYEVFVF